MITLNCATQVIVLLCSTSPGKCGKTVQFRCNLEAEFRLNFSLNTDMKIWPKRAATIRDWLLQSSAAYIRKNVASM